MQNWDLKRLWLSAFYHIDETHLIYNMVSLMWKGVQLEGTLGSQKFATTVAVLLGLSHGLVLASSSLLACLTESPTSFYSECSVGFSSVLFALKVVLNYNSPSHTNVYGILVPSRYAAWVELLVVQMFVPETSFLGHLCGILAGVIYMKASGAFSGSTSVPSLVPRIFGVLAWPVKRLGWFVWGSRSRTFGRGTVGPRRDSRPLPSSIRNRGQHSGRNESDVWRCQSCTYNNGTSVEACEMCGTVRGREAGPGVDDSPPSAPRVPTRSGRSLSPMSREELRQARLSRFNR
jgi:rhomboid domain-containing protein 1